MSDVDVRDWRRHSPYSAPGRRAALLDAVPTNIPGLSAVSRNMIVHYRSEVELPASTRGDINRRWLAAILDADQERHGSPLNEPREESRRVQGCCRDHTLFCVAVLRQHGIPARSLVGFASYFSEGYNHDHVIVQVYDDIAKRWVRFDSEIAAPADKLPSPQDISAGIDAPFRTAAEVWQGYRAATLDPSAFGVQPGSDIAGPWFIQNYVIRQTAHRYGDELLLWDSWGAMSAPGDLDSQILALTDELAALLIAAESGDSEADAALMAWYHRDERLHPGPSVVQHSPFGDPPVAVDVGAI